MTKDEIKFAIDTTISMAKAAEKLNLKFTTFKKKATTLGLYRPNQGRKGIKREEYEDNNIRISLNDILEGKFPDYPRCHLKRRLLKEGIIINKCEICNIDKWNGKELTCQLDHIDGDGKNNKLENLRMLCPNCHSQTETFSGKKNRK